MAMTGIFTIAGRRYLAEFLRTDDYDHPVYLAWGSGTTTLSAYDTKLSSEKERVQITVTRTSNVAYFEHNFTVTASTAGTYGELGVFDAAKGGLMYWVGRPDAVTKAAGELIIVHLAFVVTQL